MTGSLPGQGPLRLGLAGCGRVLETGHLPALRRSRAWQVVAACDPQETRRRFIRQNLPGIAVYESVRHMARETHLDALLVCSPPAHHRAIAAAALASGWHLLVEKPLALGAAEVDSLRALQQAADRLVWIGYTRRFRPPYVRLRQWLRRQQPGRLHSLSFELAFDPRAWGAVTSYLGEESLGGGVLADVASHQLDLLAWLLGRRPGAVRGKFLGPRTVELELDFGFARPVRCTASHERRYREQLLLAMSSGEQLLCCGGGCFRSRFIPPAGHRLLGRFITFVHLAHCKILGRPNSTQVSFEEQLNRFAAAVRGCRPSDAEADLEDGLMVWRAIEACRKSLQEEGRWIPLNS